MTTENNRVTEMNAKQFEEQTKVYGNEIKLDTVLQQDVTTADGTSTVTYKTFVKDGIVKIWPVNEIGQVISGSEPIFNDGSWNESLITRPKTHSNRTSTNQLNTTLSGLSVTETPIVTTVRSETTLNYTHGGIVGEDDVGGEYWNANLDADGEFIGNPIKPPYIVNGEEVTYDQYVEVRDFDTPENRVEALKKYGKTVEITTTTGGEVIVSGPLFNQLQEGAKDYAITTNEKVPEWADEKVKTRVDEIQDEIDRLIEEGPIKTGDRKSDMRRSMQWSKQLKDLRDKLAVEQAKVEFNQQPNGTASDMKGLSGAAEKIKYSFDRDDELAFKAPVKYPQDLSMQQDHMTIQCYTYEPPYSAEFTKTDKTADGAGGSAVGAQRGSPFRMKIGAPIILPMPNNIQDTNQRVWEESSMNNQALDAIRKAGKNTLFKSLLSDVGLGDIEASIANMQSIFQSTTQQSGRADFFANKMSQLAGDRGFDISSDQILARTGGVIANSNTELLFGGVSLRSFEFQWLLTPRDDQEAHNIRMIIRAFKQWSAPRKTSKLVSGDNPTLGGTGQAGGPSYFLGTPNVFKLKYETDGNKPILGMHQFKACALTDISVNYTPEGQWMAYERGQPTAYSMTLKFNELEPIYNTDYLGAGDTLDNRLDTKGNVTGDLTAVQTVNQFDSSTSQIGY